jgi:citronellol/citronellal dehydrogenase
LIFAEGLLAGQTAIVTGGGTGIGRGIALELARAGSNVVLAGRRREPLDEVAAQVAAFGREALVHPTDVREADQVNALAAASEARFGRIDLLVNNAGGQFGAPFEDISAKGWRAVLDVNLNGVFNCIQAASGPMIRQRRGKVVTIIAGFTRRAAPYVSHSGAARAGVENLTRSLALEWAAHNIQLNCISPVVLTETMARNMGDREGEFLDSIPAHRYASEQEVGWLVTYLASPAGDYITGEHIVMDGGYWMAVGLRHGGRGDA